MAAPTDRVQVLKQESTSGGGDASDQSTFYAWDAIVETEDGISAAGLFVQTVGGSADENAVIWRDTNDLKFADPNNPSGFTLTQLGAGGGGGLSESQHEALDRLTHQVNETSYDEITRSSGLVTTFITWTNSGKTVKIREFQLTRTNGIVSQVIAIQYDGSGVEKERNTYVITRSAGLYASATRTLL